jgi:hypothetical protein
MDKMAFICTVSIHALIESCKLVDDYCLLQCCLHTGIKNAGDLAAIVEHIDVEKAECFDPVDLIMIKGKVVEHHGSYSAFNTALHLQLKLKPLSFKVDLEQLSKRSQSTVWKLDGVKAWMACSSRALCILAEEYLGVSLRF